MNKIKYLQFINPRTGGAYFRFVNTKPKVQKIFAIFEVQNGKKEELVWMHPITKKLYHIRAKQQDALNIWVKGQDIKIHWKVIGLSTYDWTMAKDMIFPITIVGER